MISTTLSLLFLAVLAAPGIAALRRARGAFTLIEQIAYGVPLGIVVGALAILVCAIAVGFSVGLVIGGGVVAALAGWELWPDRAVPAAFRRSGRRRPPPGQCAAAAEEDTRVAALEAPSVSGVAQRTTSAVGTGLREQRFSPRDESGSVARMDAERSDKRVNDAAPLHAGLDAAPDQRPVLLDRRGLTLPLALPRWRPALLPILVIGGLGVLFALFYATSLTYDAEGLRAGNQHIWSDVSVHLGDTTSFAYAENFPPRNPFFSGHVFNYHFLIAFTSACLVKLGLDPVTSLKLHDFLISLCLTLGVFAFARRLTGDAAAAALALLLFMLGGGLGWALTVGEANRSHSLWQTLLDHPWSYDRQIAATIRWEPVFLVAIAPTRGTLYGLPLGLFSLTLLWQGLASRPTVAGRQSDSRNQDGGRFDGPAIAADAGNPLRAIQPEPSVHGTPAFQAVERAPTMFVGFPAASEAASDAGAPDRAATTGAAGIAGSSAAAERPGALARSGLAPRVRGWLTLPDRWRWFVAAGAVAGLLPYAHLGTLLALALVTPMLFLLFPRRDWLLFFGVWLLVAVPQLLLQGGAGSGHIGWYSGWMAHVDPAHADSIPWFWLKNLGLIMPLLLIALGSARLLSPAARRFLWAFMPVFLIANVVSFNPISPWDNLKVLIYWYLAACVLVGALLAHAWRSSPAPLARALLGGALLTMVLSGALMHFHQLRGLDSYELFSTDELRFAARVRAETEPQAVFATGFEHNPVVTALAGRQVLLFFPPYLVSWGIDPREREQDVRDLFAFAPDTMAIIAKYQIDYVVIGPSEEVLKPDVARFEATFPLVIQSETYKLFDVRGAKRSPFLGAAAR